MKGDVLVRPWRSSDLDAALAVLRATHVRDAYPVIWPGAPASFAAPDDALLAWVAEGSDGRLLGHVCIRHPHGPPLPSWESGTGRPADELGVVSRLYVAPDDRRSGVGTLLLETAVRAIREQAWVPVLDVLTRYRAAATMYETMGWTRLGEFVWPMPDGTEEPSYAYGLLD